MDGGWRGAQVSMTDGEFLVYKSTFGNLSPYYRIAATLGRVLGYRYSTNWYHEQAINFSSIKPCSIECNNIMFVDVAAVPMMLRSDDSIGRTAEKMAPVYFHVIYGV
jgi:hypothetical protein